MGDASKCPKCGFENNQIKFSACPKCGVIISKYYLSEERKPIELVSKPKVSNKLYENVEKQNNKNYIDVHLMTGENILHRGYMHKMPIILISLAIAPFTLILFGVFMALRSQKFAFLLLIGGIGAIVMLRLALKRTEMAVTNKRVIIKKGIFATRSLELITSKIESVVVDKGLVGNMFDYGDVIIIGSGGTKEVLKWVKAPVEFRNAVNNSMNFNMA
jgi:hypothetical protein